MGNVLATITDNKIYQTNGSLAKVVSAQDYFAFGAAMPSRSYQDVGYSKYRYGFNGKEGDSDFGKSIQDYGMRIYCPDCGRFLSVDPLTQSYPFYSPYHFAGNSPIAAIDMDGAEPKWVKNLVNTLSHWFGVSEVFDMPNADDIEEVAQLNQALSNKQANAKQLKEGLEQLHEYQKQAISMSVIGAPAVVALEVGTGQKNLSDALIDQSIDQITNKVGGKVVGKVIEAGIFTKFLAILKSPKTDEILEIDKANKELEKKLLSPESKANHTMIKWLEESIKNDTKELTESLYNKSMLELEYADLLNKGGTNKEFDAIIDKIIKIDKEIKDNELSIKLNIEAKERVINKINDK